VYLRLVRDAVPDIFGDDYDFELGAVRQLRTGTDLALVSTGPQSARILDAADRLAAAGVSAAVLHLPSIKPLDSAALSAALAGFDLVVTVEEHSVHGGLGSLVAEVLTATGPAPQIDRIGVDDSWGESASNEFMLDKHGLSAEQVAARALTLLGARVSS
jgi:transketolase